MGIHLVNDFQNRHAYLFDIAHQMTDSISGLNVPIDKETYFRIIESDESVEDYGTSSLVDINTYANLYQEILKSPDDPSFNRFIVSLV